MKHSLLILILMSTYASAQIPASVVTPTAAVSIQDDQDSTPEPLSFFAPKTEEDISALARVMDSDLSNDSED